jgi:DNA mismatch repair protein MutL
MIAKDSFPMYALFIDLDPSQLDINVHPTKQEIKFEDEKIIYAFVQSAVKHALAQFSISPTLDFELDVNIQQLDAVTKPFTEERKSSAQSSSLYQGFTQKNQAHFIEKRSDLKLWAKAAEDFYGDKELTTSLQHKEAAFELYSPIEKKVLYSNDFFQLNNSYIAVQNTAGYLLVHQQNAHERILYERFLNAVAGKSIATQKSLFPAIIELAPADAVLLSELLPDLNQLGYLLEPFGNNTYVVQGTPADVEGGNEKFTIEKMVEQYKHFSNDLKYSKREKLIRSMALQQAVKAGVKLENKEIQSLLEALFNCATPNITPNGKPTYFEFKKDELDKMFGR